MSPLDRAALRERARRSAPWDVPLAQAEVVELLDAADRLDQLEHPTPPTALHAPIEGARP